jgi:hypothetical protein
MFLVSECLRVPTNKALAMCTNPKHYMWATMPEQYLQPSRIGTSVILSEYGLRANRLNKYRFRCCPPEIALEPPTGWLSSSNIRRAEFEV